ncbi:proton-coupled folate transporter-like [Aricia agestis]|uniref:proton-coupled folate transporter-like n=1 Tax=Aricia agestis TaxID=91739 RepID=UPI001C202620|nr:proton-coupled folate transporter-like [Aricia agestis]
MKTKNKEHSSKLSSENIEQTIPLKNEKGDMKKLTIFQKIKEFKDNITVEPVVSIFMIASVIAMTGVQNLNLEKACRVNLKYNDSVCTALKLRQRDELSEAEDGVQMVVASVEAWKSVIATVFPIIMMMFIGAWSDKMGKRKVCMLMPISGELFTCIIDMVNTYFFDIVPVEWTAFLATIFLSITGGWYVMFLGSYSYLGDITSEHTRTFRMGVLTLGLSISFPVGMGVSGVLLRYTGYFGVFGIAAVLQLLILLYVCYRIQDNAEHKNISKAKRSGIVGFILDFFNFESLKEILKIVFKKAPNNRRMKLCLIMVAVCLVHGGIWGEVSIAYILCRYRFNWDELKWSIFSSYNLSLHSFGTLFSIILFTKKLKIDDSTLGIIAMLSRILGALVWTFARNDVEVFLGPIAAFFDGTMVITLRAITSKLVSSQELGKVFSLFGLFEILMMLIFVPIYSRVYMATLHVMPGAVYLLTVSISVPALFIYIWFFRDYKRQARNAALNADCAEEAIIK